jgi:hypothetical protein
LGIGHRANNPSPLKANFIPVKVSLGLGHGRILWINDISDGKMMRFGTWNKRSLYRVDSLMTVSRELSRYGLHLVGVQEVIWEGSGTEPLIDANVVHISPILVTLMMEALSYSEKSVLTRVTRRNIP